MIEQIERAAYHESGHACANIFFGSVIDHVWIDADGHGCCVRSWFQPHEFTEAICSLAGPTAEAMLTSEPAELRGEDARNYAKCALRLSRDDLLGARDFTRAIVTHQWPHIARLAGVLLMARRLDGESVARIISHGAADGTLVGLPM